jgi:hypothetical protein
VKAIIHIGQLIPYGKMGDIKINRNIHDQKQGGKKTQDHQISYKNRIKPAAHRFMIILYLPGKSHHPVEKQNILLFSDMVYKNHAPGIYIFHDCFINIRLMRGDSGDIMETSF